MKLDVAFYYPGQYWCNTDWAKNVICFFDGIAMLIPEYMEDQLGFDDYPIITSLKDHDLFHVIRPEKAIDEDATKTLAEALVDIIASGRLDHLTKASDKNARQSDFGSLSMSRLGYYGDADLADFVFEELKSRGLAEDSKDGVSIPMHRTIRALILVLLAQILRPKGESMGLKLSPTTDQVRLVNALNEILKQDSSSVSEGDIVSFDMAMVGADLSIVPIDEILDFRKQNYCQHRDYIQSVREFALELSCLPLREREVKFEQRQEKLEDLSAELKKIYHASWKKPITFSIGIAAAAAAALDSHPAIIGTLTALTTAAGLLPGKTEEIGVYSYLISAKQRFG